jgi:MscS family membrane protein
MRGRIGFGVLRFGAEVGVEFGGRTVYLCGVSKKVCLLSTSFASRLMRVVLLGCLLLQGGRVLAQDSLLLDSLAQLQEDTSKVVKERKQLLSKVQDPSTIRYNLGTPSTAIRTFLLYSSPDVNRPDSAALALYVRNPFSPEAMATAIQLRQYLDGKGYILQPETMPNDSSYLDTLQKNGQHIFYPIPEEKKIYLVKAGNSWIFSLETVNSIAGMHERLYPFGTLDWIPDNYRQESLGLALWQWIGIAVFFIVAWVIYQLLVLVLRNLLYRVVFKYFFDKIPFRPLTRTARPLAFLVIVFLLIHYLPVLQFPATLNSYLLTGLHVTVPIFIVVVVFNGVNILGYFLEHRAERTRSRMDDQLVPLVTKVLKGVVVVLGLVFVLEQLEVNVTALVAGLSIGGLALALAAQDTVKNFFGSLMIFADRPFKVGDLIHFDNTDGVIEEVGVRSTRVRTLTNSLVSVPNGKLADSVVDNLGMRRMRRMRFVLGLRLDTPPQLLEAYNEGLLELARRHPLVVKDEIDIAINEITNTSVNILVHVYFATPHWSIELKARQEFILAALNLAQKLGVVLAIPTQNLQVTAFPEKTPMLPDYTKVKPEEYGKVVQDFATNWEKGIEAKYPAQNTSNTNQ